MRVAQGGARVGDAVAFAIGALRLLPQVRVAQRRAGSFHVALLALAALCELAVVQLAALMRHRTKKGEA